MVSKKQHMILEVKNLKTYFDTPEGVVKAVDGVSFDLKKGEVLGIVGETGSGKSVTALSLLNLIPQPAGKIVEGQILLEGTDLARLNPRQMQKYRGSKISMVFQDPMTSLNPVYTIGSQIMEAIRIHQSITKNQARKKTIELLTMVGIPEPSRRLKSYPHECSGGMCQRVMVAMALANNPSVLIADEPTTALDVTIQAQILELMVKLKDRTGSAIILITHDLGVIAKYASRVMVMYGGKPVEFADVDTIFYEPLHPYTRGLMGSITRLDNKKKQRLLAIEGSCPSLIDLPPGCTFYPRCPYARKRCAQSYPGLEQVNPGRRIACHRWKNFRKGYNEGKP